MSNVKYVGMDVHKKITVIVVLNALGHMESHSKVKTTAENICDFFRGLSGKVEVVFEEGTHSAWLHKLIKPLVASVTVCDPRHNQLIEDGNKSDDDDAETLAELLRIGAVKAVYQGDDDQQQRPKEVWRADELVVGEVTRAKSRLQGIYRGRGLDPGRAIDRADQRDQWLAKLKDEATRFRAESLLDPLAALRELRKQAKRRFVLRVRQHPDDRILSCLRRFGPVHVGQLIATASDAASLPNQTAILAFLRTGGGHTIKRRLQNRRGEDRQIAEEGFDSWIESEPQSRVEACLQKRGADLSALGRVPGLLPAPGRRRHTAGIGSRLGGAQTGRCRSCSLAT